MSPPINPILLFDIGLLLAAVGQIIFRWEAIKQRLSDFKYWLDTGDKKLVYPVAVILGLLVACIASWLRWMMG